MVLGIGFWEAVVVVVVDVGEKKCEVEVWFEEEAPFLVGGEVVLWSSSSSRRGVEKEGGKAVIFCEAVEHQIGLQSFEAFHESLRRLWMRGNCGKPLPQIIKKTRRAKMIPELILFRGETATVLGKSGTVVLQKESTTIFMIEGNRCCECANIPNELSREILQMPRDSSLRMREDILATRNCPSGLIPETTSTHSNELIFTIAQVHAHEYSHFLLEVLPRLVRHLELLSTQNPLVHIGPFGVKHSFQVQALEILGISRHQLLQGDISTRAGLYFPRPSYCGVPSERIDEIRMVSKIILTKLGCELQETPLRKQKNIVLIERYVRRAFGKEVISSIRSFLLQTYPDQIQVVMFSKADVIIGQHGAGLANMVFSSSRLPTVIELGPSGPLSQIPTQYADLALSLGFGYRYLSSSSSSSGFTKFSAPSLEDLKNSINDALKR